MTLATDQEHEATHAELGIRAGAQRLGLIGESMGTFLPPTSRRLPH